MSRDLYDLALALGRAEDLIGAKGRQWKWASRPSGRTPLLWHPIDVLDSETNRWKYYESAEQYIQEGS